ncbi:MAG: hypothetical protein JSR23_09925 [Proteobacteria bacterium]|nr:hypothetical protein [Pseudomonadota bacterium]
MKTIYPPPHVYANRRFGYWRELLEHWVFQVERGYRVTTGKDPVYKYKERTNVGLLAAAATANGWVALEECRSEKMTRDEEDRYQGRSDLRIWRDSRHHELEAKFLRVALKSESTTRLDTATENSMQDAVRSLPSGAKFDRKIALTFAVPMVTTKQFERLGSEEVNRLLAELNEYVLKNAKPDFFASVYPGKAEVSGRPNRVSLGVVLFGREPVQGTEPHEAS